MAGFGIVGFGMVGFGMVLLAQEAPKQETPKKVSRSEVNGAAVSKVPPEYPSVARQLKIEGAEEPEDLITENGTVERVNIVSGNPVLTRPATEALKKWKFNPFIADGKPVKVLAQISMTFKRS